MLKTVDLVQFTGTVSGSDDVTIVAATAGHRTPSQAGLVTGDQFHYKIANADGSLWEIGIAELYEVTGTWMLTRYAALNSAGGTYATFPLSTYTITAVASSRALPAVGNYGALPSANVGGGFASGEAAVASGLHSAAIGRNAYAGGDFSGAVGEYSYASSPHSFAFGRRTRVGECAALARGSRDYDDHAGLLLWTGYASGALSPTDASSTGFRLPNVKCAALLRILISGATTDLTDSYAATITAALKRAAPGAIMAIDGTPSVTVVKDDAGSAAPVLSITGTGASSELDIDLGITTMRWNAVITASVIDLT